MSKPKKILTASVVTLVATALSIAIAASGKAQVSSVPEEKIPLALPNPQVESGEEPKETQAPKEPAYAPTSKDYRSFCYDLMRDSDGNVVDRDVFERNLDKAIAEGLILESDRTYFEDRYEYCSTNAANCGYANGMGFRNGRGNGQGGGCGRGRGQGRNWQ